MNFKYWFYIVEALEADIENKLRNYLNNPKIPIDKKQEAELELNKIKADTNKYDTKKAFDIINGILSIQKKEKPKVEDSQRKHFQSIPNTTEEELKTYDYYKNEDKKFVNEIMMLLRKFVDKKLITLKIENGIPVLYKNTLQGKEKLDTPDSTRFMAALHGIRDGLKEYTGKNKYFNPIEEELNHQDNLVAKGDKIWVFKGHAPDVCRIYGKGHHWCIASSTSAAHWFSYRINYHQTQYFVFDFNKAENNPARYVNPGVAPEGMYSEWVDARNQHKRDPEDPKSQIGIYGYTSINEYKKYLASKGIPLDTWKTTPPEDWEKRLDNYTKDKTAAKSNFLAAKNDPDPKIFPMYIKIAEAIDDSDFKTLTDEQKKDFILGKYDNLTKSQLNYAIENFKGDYVNSLQDPAEKVYIGVIINNQDLISKNISKFFETPSYEENSISDILWKAQEIAGNEYVDKVSETIIKAGVNLQEHDVFNIIKLSKNTEKILELLEEKDFRKLRYRSIYDLIFQSSDSGKMFALLLNYIPDVNIDSLLDSHESELLSFYRIKNVEDNLEKYSKKFFKNISYRNIKYLMSKSAQKEKILDLIITNRKKSDEKIIQELIINSDSDSQLEKIIDKNPVLLSHNVLFIIRRAKDKIAIIEKIGEENIKNLIPSDLNLLFDSFKNSTSYDPNELKDAVNKYYNK